MGLCLQQRGLPTYGEQFWSTITANSSALRTEQTHTAKERYRFYWGQNAANATTVV